MKKVIIITVIALSFAISNIIGQNITVGYYGGYGTYQMDDMKNMLEESLKALPVEGRIINNFPGYYNQTIQAGYSVKEHFFGLEYGLMSTGGKIGVSDYSGSLTMEMNLKANKIGLYYNYQFYNQKMGNNWLSFFAAVSPGIMFSDLELKESAHMQVSIPAMTGYQTPDNEERVTFESTNFYILPQLGVRFRFLKYFSAQIAAGYEIGINKNMTGKSGSFTDYMGNHINVSGLETQAKMDWSGFRVNAGVTILLPTKKMGR